MRIVDRLETVAKKVKELEQLAKVALYEQKNLVAHRNLLHEKAELLMTVADLVDGPEVSEEIAKKLLRFSRNAERAIELQSIFYMGALLYPDDYKGKGPNDLELVIRELRAGKM